VEPQDITPEDSVVPVYLVPLTEEELAEREQWAIEAAEREAAEEANLDARKSALAKLANLGLTEEEAKAVIGL
jgi:8-oxo-dGTP pyrophosphatase MutT (NUDIX family)